MTQVTDLEVRKKVRRVGRKCEVRQPTFQQLCGCYVQTMTLPSVEAGGWVREARDSRPLEDLARRGLIRIPEGRRLPRRARVEAAGSVSDLVTEQRR